MNISYEIKKELMVLEEGKWNLEANIVSWNGGPDKIDIRRWAPDHSQCGKGVTIPIEAFKMLQVIEI